MRNLPVIFLLDFQTEAVFAVSWCRGRRLFTWWLARLKIQNGNGKNASSHGQRQDHQLGVFSVIVVLLLFFSWSTAFAPPNELFFTASLLCSAFLWFGDPRDTPTGRERESEKEHRMHHSDNEVPKFVSRVCEAHLAA